VSHYCRHYLLLTAAALGPIWGQDLARGQAGLEISEFMASNRTIRATDVEGVSVYPDWIELHNRGRRAVHLEGYFLTDDPENLTKWACPAVSLDSDAYWLVFATGVQAEDHPTNWPYLDREGFYHTNFQLEKAGEYLALVGPDLQILQAFEPLPQAPDETGFPPQYPDMSYGLHGGQMRYFYTPTPGAANTPGYAAVSRAPAFVAPGGLFTRDFSLHMIHPSAEAAIFITLDGSEPTPDARSLQPPITVTTTTEVAARAYEPGKAPSPVVTQTYIKATSEVLDFHSNLPVVLVHTQGRSINQSRFTRASAVIVDVDDSGRARVMDLPDYCGRGGIRVRGSSTSGQAKHQYAFETWDLYDQDRDVSVLGFPAESDWILYAPYQYDRALINNALAYELSNQAGRYAVRTRFCEMYLQTQHATLSADYYVGLYILMEKIKQGPDRVAVEDLEPWDRSAPRIQGGYLLSIDRRSSNAGFNTARNGTFFNMLYPSDTRVTSAQINWIKSYLDRFEAALYGPGFADPQTGYAQHIDVASFVDHHLLNLLPINVDAFRLSGYLHKSRTGPLELGPVWDFDRAFESTDGRDDNPESWSGNGGGTDFLRFLWWDRLFDDPNFWQRLIDRWFELRRTVFSEDNLFDTIDRLAAEVQEAQVRNTRRWPGQGPRFGGFAGEIVHLKDWLTRRVQWIDSRFVPPPEIVVSSPPAEGLARVQFAHAHPQGRVYYTLDGSDPRAFGEPVLESDIWTLVAAEAAKKVLIPTGPVLANWQDLSFDDTDWLSVQGAPGGIGYEQGTGYAHLLSRDVASQMVGQQTGCLVRIPFNIGRSQSRAGYLSLRMQYDDGFVAYLNGVEVARALCTGEPEWDTRADGNHESQGMEVFDLSSYGHLLNAGSNLLAIHGLNTSATSSDFLVWAELLGSDEDLTASSGIAETALADTGPILLHESTRIRARVLVDENDYSPWSAPAETVVAVGPVAESLCFTELMYHPSDPNTEFIELHNGGTEVINLNFVAFTDGIDFTFPSLPLAPQAYCLIVEDRAAFEGRYGTELPVAGEYAGKLSNSGERIVLQDAAGQIIHDFAYRDSWYPTTDGEGHSLVVQQPSTVDPNTLSNPSSWRPSLQPGGSPGTADH
jgi:hypothetical protein